MWLLQACKAKPDKNIEELMLWSADRIMELISLLQSAYNPSCLCSCDASMQCQSCADLLASILKCLSHQQGESLHSPATATRSKPHMASLNSSGLLILCHVPLPQRVRNPNSETRHHHPQGNRCTCLHAQARRVHVEVCEGQADSVFADAGACLALIRSSGQSPSGQQHRPAAQSLPQASKQAGHRHRNQVIRQ